MISQADIIRSLVNNNCTDESIMSIALSPDCTPPKLMEKFKEAERFDLALDVSMKLGLDTSPIWKTWAMRCLKIRNFSSARDKFRHCFQRLRSSAGRGSPACSNLLCDILNELKSMEETKLTLIEEIDLIKDRKSRHEPGASSDRGRYSGSPSALESKPKIFSECLYYLKEYGTIEDHIKFFTRNMLWNETVKLLLKHREVINADKFFIIHVVLRASVTGRLDKLLANLMEQDPDMKLAVKYYKAMYNYYTIHKRFNSLYYLQNTIGDYVAAGENQLNNFFLRRPMSSYKELNARLSRLIEAGQNYREYVNRCKELEASDIHASKNQSELFTNVALEKAELRLRTIDDQIEITNNFAINEVQGCINNIRVVCENMEAPEKHGYADKGNETPVTLFDTSKRRLTFLAALVLIYYDLECRAYFSTSGMNLANKLIRDYELDKISVFKTAMRIVIEDESCDTMDNANLLLQRLTQDHLASPKRPANINSHKSRKKSSKYVVIREVAHIAEHDSLNTNTSDTQSVSSSSSSTPAALTKGSTNNQSPEVPQESTRIRPPKQGTKESARVLCDDVVRDSIRSCPEPDYKMKLAILLSPEAKIQLYLELGKLSNAQRLAFDMNRRDHVVTVLKEAERLNQDHIKDVCQHWLAKH